MHELPEGLTNSLRSFRGSVYGNRKSGQDDEKDLGELEKGSEDDRSQTYIDDREGARLEKGSEGGEDDAYRYDRAFESSDGSVSMGQAESAKSVQSPRGVYGYDGADNGGQEDLVPEALFEERAPVPAEASPQAALPNGSISQTKSNPQQPSPFLQVPNSSDRPQRPTIQQQTTKSTIYRAAPVRDIDPAAARLALDPTPLSIESFYELMGINPPPSPPSGKKESLAQLAKNHGLYGMILKDMRHTQQKYRVFDVAAYTLLVVQIVISAIFIILGSIPRVNSGIAIAVLGAVATVISGTLALMKGQGLPNRLRQSRDGFKTVLFEAEELWWDVRSGRPVLYKDIKKIREDYLRVLEAQKGNHPDAWAEGGGGYGGRGGGGGPGGGNAARAAGAGLDGKEGVGGGRGGAGGK